MTDLRATIKEINITETKCCEWCNYPTLTKNIIPCSKCKLKVCHGCITFINDKPFCNDCVVRFVREDSLFIMTKSGRDV
jgi:hypothetical protein